MEKVGKYLFASAIAILFFAIAFSAVAQPPCNIRYFVLNPNSEVVPGPLVSPGYYTVWTGLASSTNWWTHGQFLFEGGHKYLITMMNLPENGGSVYLGVDTADLASYPYPTQDMATIYYVNADESDVYMVTVCP
jgi:hypothetical protein